MANKFEIFIKDLEALDKFTAYFSQFLRKGDKINLSGDLGVGKTSFVRSLLRHFLQSPNLEVVSPTFTLVQYYEKKDFFLVHADLYRLSSAVEVLELDLDSAAEDGLLLIEWPEKGEPYLIAANIVITFIHESLGRRLVFEIDDETKRYYDTASFFEGGPSFFMKEG